MKNDYFIGISNPPQWLTDRNRKIHFCRLKRIEKVLRARPFSAINESRICSLLESAKLMIHKMEMKSVRIQLARKVVLPRIRESYPGQLWPLVTMLRRLLGLTVNWHWRLIGLL